MSRHAVAEVDGNRTRRTGVARPNRFEGGGAHQVPRHLLVEASTLSDDVSGPTRRRTRTLGDECTAPPSGRSRWSSRLQRDRPRDPRQHDRKQPPQTSAGSHRGLLHRQLLRLDGRPERTTATHRGRSTASRARRSTRNPRTGAGDVAIRKRAPTRDETAQLSLGDRLGRTADTSRRTPSHATDTGVPRIVVATATTAAPGWRTSNGAARAEPLEGHLVG